jgi:mono/diheme cytochrome c family protein
LLVLAGCSGCDRRTPIAEGSAERGRALFVAHCALCHGERADGRGVRRSALSSRPVDFTRPEWRRQAGFDTVNAAIRDGVRGTPMPGWKATLTPDEIADLTAYVLSVAGQERP